MSGLDDRLHGFRECRESGANEAQRQLRGKHFNTVIDKYWPMLLKNWSGKSRFSADFIW
jgi:hypothetical protein